LRIGIPPYLLATYCRRHRDGAIRTRYGP